MNKPTEDGNTGKSEVSSGKDAELDEEMLGNINGGEGVVTPIDALVVISPLSKVSLDNVKSTYEKPR